MVIKLLFIVKFVRLEFHAHSLLALEKVKFIKKFKKKVIKVHFHKSIRYIFTNNNEKK